eukprot:10428-Eustigmatos_ZCMA.PRE.1
MVCVKSTTYSEFEANDALRTGGTVTSIKDYTILANSAHRASRKQVEGERPGGYYGLSLIYRG